MPKTVCTHVFGIVLYNVALETTNQLFISQYSLWLDHHLGPQLLTKVWKSFGEFGPQPTDPKEA